MASKMSLYRVVVMGDGGVGKTALTIQICLSHFVETYDPTIEDSYRKQISLDSESAMLEVLDTAGQEEYTALRDQWIRDGDGFVLAYSITSRSSLHRVAPLYKQIQRTKLMAPGAPPRTDASGALRLVPVVLVGNKCDRTTEREVSMQEGAALAKQLGCAFVEASALTCVNVEKAFFDLCRAIRRQRIESEGGIDSTPVLTNKTPMAQSDVGKERDNGVLKRKKSPRRVTRERLTRGKCVIL